METVKMKYLYLSLTCLLISACVECKTNSTEPEKTTKPPKKTAKAASQTEVTLTPKPKPTAKTVQVNPNFNPASFNAQIHHVHPGFLQIPSESLPLDPRYDTISYSTPTAPNFSLQNPSPTKLSSYAEAPHQNNRNQHSFILDQNGKRYQVDQTQFQRSQQNLNTAIGAISAHILSQNNNREYIPYPPNGNPSEYAEYQEHNYPNEPLLGAYERANRAGYGFYPTGNLEKSDPRQYYPDFEQYHDYADQYDQFGFNYYGNAPSFGQFGIYHPSVQSNNLNRNHRDREYVSADRRSQVNDRGNEPIKRHLKK